MSITIAATSTAEVAMTSLRLSAADAFSAPDEMLFAKSRYIAICNSFITMENASTA